MINKTLSLILGALLLGGCIANSGHSVSHAAKTAPPMTTEALLATSVSDFQAHQPPSPVDFRNVYAGYVVKDDGTKLHVLCGEFLPAEGGDEAEWAYFATLQTSHYEQWLGANAASTCNPSSANLQKDKDLSAEMKNRLGLKP